MADVSLALGLLMLVPQAVAGGYYYITLEKYSPYIANNVTGLLLSGHPILPLMYPIFYAAIALVPVLSLLGVYGLWVTFRNRVSRLAVIGAGVLSEAIMVMIEFVNDSSRYPYLFLNA